MTDQSPIVRVEFEYADGSIQRLTGPPAEAWLEDINSVVMAAHLRYSRSQMDEYPWEWTDKVTEKKRMDLDRYRDYEGTD